MPLATRDKNLLKIVAALPIAAAACTYALRALSLALGASESPLLSGLGLLWCGYLGARVVVGLEDAVGAA